MTAPTKTRLDHLGVWANMARSGEEQCALLVYGPRRRCSRRATHGLYCWQHADGLDGPTLSE
jgi:hypothetical protein